MNGATILDRKYGPQLPGADWKVVGTGAFSNDGQTDLVLQNSMTHQVSVWFLNGLSRTGGAYVTSLPSGWNVVGVGDFNNDNSPDLLLQNPTTAAVSTYLMSGTTVTDRQYLYPTPATGTRGVNPNWHIVGADSLGGGVNLIVFQNQASGAVSLWAMQGLSLVYADYLALSLDPNWKVVAFPTAGL